MPQTYSRLPSGEIASPLGISAARLGAALAGALDSELLVCHVVPELLPAGALFAAFRRADASASRERRKL